MILGNREIRTKWLARVTIVLLRVVEEFVINRALWISVIPVASFAIVLAIGGLTFGDVFIIDSHLNLIRILIAR